MKKLIVLSVAACLFCASTVIFAQRGTGPDGRPAKSARDICMRKCQESMDKCVEKGDLSRIECAKQNSDCEKSCEEMLK